MASPSQLSKPLQDDDLSHQQEYGHEQGRETLTTRQKVIGIVRIIFGVAWAVAAFLKWQPAFIKSFADTVSSGAQAGQPAFIHAWISLWANIVMVNPTLFGYLAAITETILAVCFIMGLFTNAACVLSIVWACIIWSVAEGFGSPFTLGQSTDIGTAFPYILLSVLMLVLQGGLYYGLDRVLTARLGRYGFLASGRVRKESVDESYTLPETYEY